jgi:hypothetical protein
MTLGLAYLRDPVVTARADRMLVEPIVTRMHPHG